jgi:hypothetical protein
MFGIFLRALPFSNLGGDSTATRKQAIVHRQQCKSRQRLNTAARREITSPSEIRSRVYVQAVASCHIHP